ncbi:MAG: diaminopimelate epimerase [Deltaproteobacteria bacterium]
MKRIPFVKMEGAGNDFALVDARRAHRAVCRPAFARRICDRKFGAGADGLLVLLASRQADVRMRIFNADGSEAGMCGNGARCLALYYGRRSGKKTFSVETAAGVQEARLTGPASVRLRLPDPTDIRLGRTVRLKGRTLEVDYIDTGVPHAVVEVEDLERVPVLELGRAIRRHELFMPSGTNVDFMRIRDARRIDIRTYERGVEDETLACGTGSVAAAVIGALNHARTGFEGADGAALRHRIRVHTRGGGILTVSFRVSKRAVTDMGLEGAARIVYEGVYYV